MGRPTLLALLAGLFVMASFGDPAAAACSNEQLRVGSSAGLPDCRAYEMVSPADKNGYDVSASGTPETALAQASARGDRIAYAANGAFPGAASGAAIGFYLASRGEGGWSSQSLLPPQAFSYAVPGEATDPVFAAYSQDLSRAALLDATDSPPLVAGEQETGSTGAANLFVRNDATGSYSLIDAAAPGIVPSPYEPTFDGASSGFASVIFDAHASLMPEAPGGGVDDLYEWSGGPVALVSQVPPAGATSCGPGGSACVPAATGGRFGDENAFAGAIDRAGSLVGAISSDGSRVFFTAEGKLYVRENGTTTVQLDASRGAGPGGGGVWATASANGARAFFYDDSSAGLTPDTAPGSGVNLYSYDTGSGTLTDLTPAPQAGVKGVVDTASEDGSYLYFVATGVLTSAKNNLGEEALAGGENLYLAHGGAISFVHTLSDPGEYVYSKALGLLRHNASRVTPDGRHLAFFAKDGRFLQSGFPLFDELFEYDAGSGRLSKLCDCTGSEFRQISLVGTLDQALGVFQYTRGLSDDGSRVLFESYDSLLPADANGQPDVYEHEQDGVGGCEAPSGCLSLISTGASPDGSWFADASADGNEVFFTTSQQLAGSDADGAYDLYDARVGGGFPSPPAPGSCGSDACQPPAPLLEDPTPASLTFAGPGNLAPTVAKHPTKKKRKKQKKRARSGRKRIRHRKAKRR